MDTHDDLLRQHQQKMEMHRRWMQEQHQALRSGGLTHSLSAVPATETARSEAQFSSSMYASAKSTIGGSSPAPYAPTPAMATHMKSTPRGSQVPHHVSSGSTPRSPQTRGVGGAEGYPLQPFSVVRRTPPGEQPPRDIMADDFEHFVTVNSGSPIAVFMRGTQWAKRREQRLEEQRVARERDELADCTFSPTYESARRAGRGADPSRLEEAPQYDANGASPDRGSNFSASRRSAAGGGGGAVPITDVAAGIQEHLERQQKARQLVKEKEERLFSAGTKWTPVPTLVEPFHLGQRVDVGTIRALHQPIQAPHRSLLELGNVYQPYTSASPPRTESGVEAFAGIPPPGHFSRVGPQRAAPQ